MFIALWAVISLYVTILMAILSYFTRFTWRGRMTAAGILGWKRSKYWRPILRNSKSPETLRNVLKEIKKNPRQRWRPGGPHPAHEGGAPPQGAPLPRGPPGGSPTSIFSYMKSFDEKKNKKQPFGTRLRRHEVEPWWNQSRAPAELFYQGYFPPGGGKSSPSSSPTLLSSGEGNLHQHIHQHHLISKP